MPDRSAARPRRPGGLTALVTGLVAAAVVASGCSVIPASNTAQPAGAPAPPAGAGPCCRLLVRGPQVGWSAQQVVQYFLLASAIGADHYAVARQYLTKSASDAWRPGSSVTILTQAPTITANRPGRVNGQLNRSYFLVSGHEQARLNSAGQYIAAPRGVPAPTEQFGLQYSKGVWKISQLFNAISGKVSHELLLTSDLFHLEYTPRNLYYYGYRNDKLLPYPVFVPIQGTDPAVALIKDLISGPTGWLLGPAHSAFPPTSHLVPPIQVFPGPSGGRTAVVDIAVPPQPGGFDVQAMAAQLVTTLTSPVYSPPLFRAVKLKINGRPWPPRHGGATLSASTYQRDIPRWPAGEKAYYLSQDGVLRTLAARSDRGSTVIRGNGTLPVTFSQIAVSLGGSHLAGLAGPGNNTIYTGNLVDVGGRQSLTQLRRQFTAIKFTSLSWDRFGDLWVTGRNRAGPGVWVLAGGHWPANQLTGTTDYGRITDLRVAPDGNRVAMIVGSKGHGHLVLAAITHDPSGFLLSPPAPLRPSLPPVTALTWYDEDHLLAVTGTGPSSQLWEVPLDGDSPVRLTKQPWILTVTAAGPGNPMYLGFAGGRMQKAAGPIQPLTDIPAGQAIIYPG